MKYVQNKENGIDTVDCNIHLIEEHEKVKNKRIRSLYAQNIPRPKDETKKRWK